MLHRPSAVLIAFAFASLSISIDGTVVAPAEFREIVNGSEIIAFGRVVDATPELSDDRHRVETVVTLQVATYLKGGPGETLVFVVPGGQIGRYRDVLVGAPTFEPGEEAVVFLNARVGERPTVFGLYQGVFRIRVDESSKRRLVVSPVLVAAGQAPERVVRGAATRRPVTLETFGAQVQSVVAEGALRGAR